MLNFKHLKKIKTMNNLLKIKICALASIFFININLYAQNTETKPHYTTVNNIFSLEIGMTYSEAVATLNSKPINVLNNTKTNGMILEFKYLIKSKKLKHGTEAYNYKSYTSSNDHYHDEKSLYLFFDNKKVLKSYHTDTGKKLSNDVLSWESTFDIINDKKDNCETCVIQN